MRTFELNGAMPVSMKTPVTEQPVREPEMVMQPGPIMQSIIAERMALNALFQRRNLIAKRNPFDLPLLPEEARPKFDIGRGRG